MAAPSGTDAAPETEITALQQVPRMPVARSSLAGGLDLQGIAAPRRADPEAAMTTAGARVSPPPAAEVVSDDAPATEFRVVFRPLQSPDPAGEIASTVAEATVPTLDRMEPGEPS